MKYLDITEFNYVEYTAKNGWEFGKNQIQQLHLGNKKNVPQQETELHNK